MNDVVRLEEPAACTDRELRDFERLVREGFDGSDESLPGRIRDAERLAFHYGADGTLIAIAGLKAPDAWTRNDLFRRAEADVRAADYRLELGWVFVLPEHRGRRIGGGLCRQLLAAARGSHVFARTRPSNATMIHILQDLGFERLGKPVPRPERNEELALFVRAIG